MLRTPNDKVNQQVVTFFFVFSRFEYALKCAGYVFSRNKRGDAEVDWTRFTKKLGKRFFKKVQEAECATYLISSPPKRQVLKENQLSWQEVSAIANVQDLFGAVRRVRNNLFHGGKFPTGPVEDPARNPKLLKQAIGVIEAAMQDNSDVRSYFCEE